ncbi:MAG: methyltransferase [Oscillospiraceae bacterium]|nr:methyltransferase [Oscillospiraceae bacterium]
METLHNGYTLDICTGGFPLSTDSMALAGFVKLKRQENVLDLGSGCGTLGLLLCAKDPGCTVTGVELDENAHNTALENSRRNGLSTRLTSICLDLTQIPSQFAAGSFSACVSNPPYFSGGPASETHAAARREEHCSLEDLMRSAAWALRYGGSFFLVHRPERLAQICSLGSRYLLEPKRLCLLRHRQDGPVTLVLVECRKGGKPGLLWEELVLFHADGSPTDDYKKLYHL